MANWESSSFLTELLEYINGSEPGGALAQKRAFTEFELFGGNRKQIFIGRGEFYAATLERADTEKTTGWPIQKSRDLWVQDPDQIVSQARPRTKNDFNASIGAHQINGYLFNKGSGLEASIFGDEIFIAYMLQTYSNIKVYTDGTSEEHNVTKPSIYVYGRPGAPKWNETRKQFTFHWEDKSKTDSNGVASGFNWRYGFFDTKELIDEYDEFLRGRIAPLLLGGFNPDDSFTNGRPANLVALFKEHLNGKEVSSWTDNQRRLFLLMSGRYYKPNDYAFLNIMDADNKPIYKGIPTDVREFWKANYQAAAAIEDAKQGTVGVTAQIEGLIGEAPTLQAFARYITHGAPQDQDFASKVRPYTDYNNPNETVKYPAFSSLVSSDSDTPDPKFLTLLYPDYKFKDKIFEMDALTDLSDDPTDVFALIGRKERDLSTPEDITYAGFWPGAQRLTNWKALGEKNLIPGNRLSQVKNSGVPTSPANVDTLLQQEGSAGSVTTIGGEIKWTETVVDGRPPPTTVDYWFDKLNSPPVGEFFTIPETNTLLDFRPSEYIGKLQSALGQAVANEAGEDTKITTNPLLIKTIYDPLEKVITLIQEEHRKFENRARKLSENFQKFGATPEATTDVLLTTPDLSTEEEYSKQLWIDSVNAAAVKVAKWIEYVQSNTTIAVRWLLIVDLQEKNKTNDEIAKILQDTGLTKGKPSDQSKTPFDIGLKAPPGTLGVDEIPEEEAKARLEERKKNIDQCLLSTNIDTFKKAYRSKIAEDIFATGAEGANTIHKNDLPFGGRFYCLADSSGQHSEVPNFLAAPKGEKIRPFLDMTPDIMSALTPKIRLYRIYTDPGGDDIETEFIFENFVSQDEIKSLADAANIEKGRGGGIKSFSFSYEGGTPATAKKDINAELVLFFQSFNELTKERKSNNIMYKYIDLLLYPNNRSGLKDSSDIHPNQYNPTNFRIRADVGWNQRKDEAFKRMLLERYKDRAKGKNLQDQQNDILKQFNDGLELINKSFLLNMIDHDIDFRNDGSVEIKITYAAYIESETRTAKVNALSTPEIEKFSKQQNDEIEKLISGGTCTTKQINQLKRDRQAAQNAYIQAAQGSIVKRLNDRGLQRSAVFKENEVKDYLKDFASTNPKPIGEITLDQQAESGQRQVNFYFLGDIIHTVMDCLYETDVKIDKDYDPKKDVLKEYTRRRKELKNYIPILSSFIYSDYNSEEPIFDANIIDMPISVKFFNEWMVDNVVKSERTVYPLMNFIRDILKAVVDLLTDACLNRQIDVSLMFQTAQYRAIGKKQDGQFLDPLNPELLTGDSVNQDAVRFADSLYEQSFLPFKSGDEDNGARQKLDKYFDYTLVYAVSPTLSAGHQGRGIRSQDEKKGTYHFQIGSTRGLLKNIKFSKTDMAYLREARFYNQGNYGLLQLGAVYNVQLELFGNTLFYPGMEVFVDPRGFGGSQWDPTTGGNGRSVANALGIGGYHVITKVNSTISPSGFNTTINALFQYSGDGSSRTMAIDGKSIKTAPATDIKDKPETPRDPRCAQALNNALARTVQAISKKKAKKKRKIESKR